MCVSCVFSLLFFFDYYDYGYDYYYSLFAFFHLPVCCLLRDRKKSWSCMGREDLVGVKEEKVNSQFKKNSKCEDSCGPFSFGLRKPNHNMHKLKGS